MRSRSSLTTLRYGPCDMKRIAAGPIMNISMLGITKKISTSTIFTGARPAVSSAR